MSYIGQPPVLSNFPVDSFTATAGQTAFALSRAVAGANSLLVSINGAIQLPGTSYTVSGTTLTLAAGAIAGDAVWVWHLGVQGIVQEPADGTVTFAKITNLIQLGTPIATTSGTSHDFTGIPAGVRRISVGFAGVSMNATAKGLIQLGDSGGIETTGYTSTQGAYASAGTGTTQTSTAGFIAFNLAAADVTHGGIVLQLVNPSTNLWVAYGSLGYTTGMQVVAGVKSLSAELTQLRLTSEAGTATFDAGSVNITYEK